MLHSDSFLIVGAAGRLLRLYCPFKVRCIKSATRIEKGKIYDVQRVAFSDLWRFQYFINGELHNYEYFELV
ncbi:hypothetical protein GYB22_11880 [bacterium]|nr:hypothetical protein [bacterium]